MKETQLNPNEMCRCCRQEGLIMASIFDANEHDPEGSNIDEMLMACGGIVVERGDGFPEYLCISCLNRVKDAVALRKQLQHSQSTFMRSVDEKTNSHTENNELIQKLFDFLPPKEENEQDENVDCAQNVEITHESDQDEETSDECSQKKRDTNGTSMRCGECKKYYSSLKSLRLHAKRYHELKKLYECVICMKRYNRIEHMKRHLVIHLKKKPFSCEKCQRAFSRKDNFQHHQTICESNSSFACNVCNKKFIRKDALQTHEKSHDDAEIRTQLLTLSMNDLQDWRKFCRDVDPSSDSNSNAISAPIEKICDYSSINSPNGEVAESSAHQSNDEDSKTNSKCARKKRSIKTVSKQSKNAEAKLLATCERQFKCAECCKAFKQKAHLVEHAKIHDVNAKKFLCSECGMRFIRNDFLVIHMRRHRGEKPYKCTYCGKGFARVNDLTVHERYHTGEKSHLCTICGHGFNRSYNLTIHMRKHTGEKPYKCPYCESAFSQRNDMKAHIRRHTGERFRCDMCPEAFLMKYMLTNHLRCTHGLNIVSSTGRLNPPMNKFSDDAENSSEIRLK